MLSGSLKLHLSPTLACARQLVEMSSADSGNCAVSFYRKRAGAKQQPWPQNISLQATVPAVQPSDVNSSQVLLCSWHWAPPGNEEEHCISPGIFGEGIESWAGLCESLCSGAAPAISWSSVPLQAVTLCPC